MTDGMSILLGVSTTYVLLLFCRCLLGWSNKSCRESTDPGIGVAQTTGSQQVQADVVQTWTNRAGTMAVLADGIGSANTGAVCAQIAADTVLDRFESYHELNDPVYFFRSAFREANNRIQKTTGERRGGASVGAAFLDRSHLYYAVAGNVRIAIMRGEEIIPLSKGQTVDVLAVQAYEEGKISRQDTLWSMDEKRVWNYLGQDGFREIEICDRPILLKQGDKVLLMSKGIFEEISWSETEDILVDSVSLQELAERMVDAAEQKKNPQADNGSVILLQGLEA